MSVKQNLFVAVFVHKCLMLNDVEYTIFRMFVTQMSNYLFVTFFQLMFYKTLRYRLARALGGEVMVPRDNRTLVFSTELLNYIIPFATQGKIGHYNI